MSNFLCICSHGNVRSACLAREIKDINGPCIKTDEIYQKEFIKHQAVAIGAHCNHIDTITHFASWADFVIDLSDNNQEVQERLYNIAKEKYVRIDIGGDRWANPFHPELRGICQDIIRQMKEKGML